MKLIVGESSKLLEPVVEQLSRDPEGENLLKAFSELGGTIRTLDAGKELKGRWDWESKRLELNPSVLDEAANALTYLVFELFNAFQTAEFQKVASDPCLSLDERVEQVERLEHASALKAKELGLRLFGKDTEFDYKYVSEDFSHYYLAQQLSNHAGRIAAKCANEGEEYIGTPGVKDLDQNGKDYLYALLFHAVRLKESPEHENQFTQTLSAIKRLAPINETCQKVLSIWNNLDSDDASSGT
ncbi:hypothetical protein [Simkania sp.]|uniref:hypothetical protein n=1 Tax=Simkania sp. TaxID=34094 RepID=UPI003B528D6D